MARIQIRRDTAANWASNNPILFAGELGYDLSSGRAKLGNGVSTWKALPFVPQFSQSATAWSFTDNFDRANGAITSTDWQTFNSFGGVESPTIITNQVYRSGTPSSADWQDGAICMSDSGSLSHFAEISIPTLNCGNEVDFFSGSPAAAVMVRATPLVVLGAVNNYNRNSDVQNWAATPLCVWGAIKNAHWMVWVGTPAGRTDVGIGPFKQFGRNARGIARGTGTFTGGNILRLEVFGDDRLVLKYGATTLWEGTDFDLPRGRHVGFNPGGPNNRIDNFNAGLITS